MNTTNSAALESRGLRAPANRVSRKAIWYWTINAAIFWLVVIGAQVLGVVISSPNVPGWLAVTLTISVILGICYVAIMPTWRYRVHRWEITPDAVYTQSGWLNQEWRVAPISRIQTVDAERGPIEQLFGLSKVTVTTASAAGPIHIKCLDVATANTVVEELTQASQATRGDAT